jgi:aminopeptidase N
MRRSQHASEQWRSRGTALVLAVLLAAVGIPGFAGDPRHAGTALQPAMDVVHYRIEVALDMSSGLLGGRVTMTALLKSATTAIILNAACLTIDSARVSGETWGVTRDSLSETITLHSPGASRAAGETIAVTIDYRRLPGTPRPGGRWGYYFFLDTLGLPSNLGYTMAEPSDARFWLPCVDTPTDKATADLLVTVPQGYVAASNGKLVGVTSGPGTTTVWHWQESHQIATYLIAITASRFTIATLPFVRAARDTVPVQYYVWQVDSAECAGYLPTVRDMLAGLSKVFGPYPFDKYGMTAVVPFGYGGMEHQTITTMNRYLKTDEKVVVHELAHQWWGDLVTCGTWKDVWLNESFATYAEALWAEQKGGRAALRSYMHSSLEHFFYGSWQGGPYDPEGQGFNLFDDVVYSKGAWVLHMLRGTLGDSLFFASLSRYRDLYAGTTATTEDLASVIEDVSGRSIGWFFNEWVYGKGWPIYGSNCRWSSDTLHIRLTQQQSLSWPVFRTPLRINVKNAVTDTILTIVPTARVYETAVFLPFSPTSAVLDPDSLVLKQTSDDTLTVEVPPLPTAFVLAQNYPNPFNAGTMITYSIPVIDGQKGAAIPVKIAVYDVLGREVEVLVDALQVPGTYRKQFTGAGRASGAYFLRCVAGGNTAVKSMLLIR